MRSVLLSPVVLVLVSVVACSSSSVDAEPPTIDGGVEAGPSTADPEKDAGAPDVMRPDVEPASRLAVACAQDPCYVAVSGTGGEHICGLLKDGTVRCWGRDTRARAEVPPDGGPGEADGALGRGRVVPVVEGATPALVVGLTGVKQISVGRNLGTCALTEDGSVYCWGRNEFGQLGRSSDQARLPVAIRVEGLPPASAVALGARTGCAIASADGALWCWGARSTQIGSAAAPGEGDTFPPQVMTGFTAPIRELAIGTTPSDATDLGQDTIVALQSGGVLASLGHFPAGESSVPQPISSEPQVLRDVVRIGAFGYLGRSGILYRWLPAPRALYVLNAATVVDVTITAGAVFVDDEWANYVEQGGILLSSGRLYRWGRNTSGALGYAPSELDVADEPLDMTHVAGDRVVSFAMTAASTCVSLVDGTVKCWGANQRGELGRGTVDPAQHPEAELIR
jgi:Regulator of chromosome condensation (RCC1) repeat